jgi:hypothetical protein
MTLQEKRTSMFALVESWRESDKTQIEFARDHNLTVSKFRYWVHKSRAFGSDGASSGFIRIPGNGFSGSGVNNEIQLHYPNGVSLSLPADTSLSVLKNLIDY